MLRPSQQIQSEKKWRRIQDDPEKHRRQKEYQRKWDKKHPPSFERLEKNKEYIKQMKKLSKEIGNCTKCYQPKENSKFVICEKCRKKAREYQQKLRLKKGENETSIQEMA